jgi:hypothetical protein
MSCVICANLERAYQAELNEYLVARSLASYRASTMFAAQKNVDMERSKYELEEHRKVCLRCRCPQARARAGQAGECEETGGMAERSASSLFGRRLMVGQLPLEQRIGVRIPTAEPL